MKLRTLAFVAATAAGLALPAAASAQTSPIGRANTFGLGLALGFPDVGLALNPYLSARNSLQIDLAFGYRHAAFLGRVDFLFWMPPLASAGWGDLRWYVGPGVYAGFASGRYQTVTGRDYSSFVIGAEAPIGLALLFKFPIDLALEVVPRLQLITGDGPGLWFDIAAALHVRYYF